jgi:two-component system, OmpR family, sensor histidine kinase TctE
MSSFALRPVQAQPRPSMRSRMLRRVLLPLVLIWVMGSLTAFAVAHFFTLEAFDRALIDDARVIAARVVEQDGRLILDFSERELGTLLFNKSEREFFAVVQADGSVVASSAPLRPGKLEPGQRWAFSDASHDGSDLRVATFDPQGARAFTVIVAQTTHERQELLRRLGTYSRLPQALLVMWLGWWVYRSVGQEMVPLERLQAALERRDSSDLTPLDTSAPSLEVERLAQTINELMLRVDRGVQAQREFTGNVAHELRTPLAGIRALADYGLAQTDPKQWQAQLRGIAASQERASRLVDQLLALALADEARDSLALEPVRVDEIARNTLLAQLARADALGVDLGGVGLDEEVSAIGSAVLIEGVLNNLIDNALRYGRPADARRPSVTVEVRHHGGAVRLSVADNGPGIDAAQRERLVRRWAQGQAGVARGEGAGLGLAIVSRYAALLGGGLSLEAGTDGCGLRVELKLRAAAARAAPSPSHN